MNIRKKLGVQLIALGISLASVGTAFAAGWGQQNGKYYFIDPKNNEKVSGKWIHTSSGYYYIGADTYMVTGWKKINNAWHYFRPSGLMVTGWREVDKHWYYLKSDGTMQTGWLKLQKDGKDVWYYLKSYGAMATGWRKIADKWYYFNPEDGSLVMQKWQKIADKWYYFGNDGSMQSGWINLNGTY